MFTFYLALKGNENKIYDPYSQRKAVNMDHKNGVVRNYSIKEIDIIREMRTIYIRNEKGKTTGNKNEHRLISLF